MSNYSKATDFASKDSLPTGDPLKIVKGTEIDDEFEALETSIASKADLTSTSQIITAASVKLNTVYLGQSTTDWKITQSGTDLIFSYAGTDKGKLDTSGNFTVIGNVIAGGTI